MLVTPLPGTTREHLLETLKYLHTTVVNLTSSGGPAHDRLTYYIEWTTTAGQHLANQIAADDLNKLVLTPGYDRLLARVGIMTGLDAGTQRALNGLVSRELNQRVDDFATAITTLAEQIAHWDRTGLLVVADTTIYIEHEEKLEILDFRPVLSVGGQAVHLLVPIIVVDELDGLKKSKDRDTRWRAGYTLAVFDRRFTDTNRPVRLTAEDFSALESGRLPRGEVTMEMVFDPPGHVRLPINDDEIIDRTLGIQALAGRGVTLLTFDTGQSTRARSAGLSVVKLSHALEEEPVPAKNGRTR
jgi:hypothetical protein